MSDPYADFTVFDLNFDALPFVDQKNKPLTVAGVVNRDTSNYISGGGAASFTTGVNRITTPASVDFAFSNGDFTVEGWAYLTAYNTWGFLLSTDDTTNSNSGWFVQIIGIGSGFTPGTISCGFRTGGSVFSMQSPSTSLCTLNTWHHIAYTRNNGTNTLWLDGFGIARAVDGRVVSNSFSLAVANSTLNPSAANQLVGNVDSVRVTKGVARYNVPFDPITGLSLDLKARVRGQRQRVHYRDQSPAQTVVATRRFYGGRVSDPQFYGVGYVAGTTKVKGRPTNAPVRRQVRLVEESSGVVVRVMWSDATTGEYRFNNVDERRKYTVISYDYEHNFRAVIADNITPELLP